MTVYPAIDIRGGRCVRLSQGRADREKVYRADPAEAAAEFRAAGAAWVHVVDLDGAFSGEPANLPQIPRIAAGGLQVQYGGGLRSREAAARALDLGAARVVLGTRAARDEAFVAALAREFGDRIAVGIDAKDGQVAVRGWVETTAVRASDLARRMAEAGVGTLIFTDIATDGMLTGPNTAALAEVLAAAGCRVIASGGVSGLGDIERLAEMSARHPALEGVIVGRAIYEGRLALADALAAAAC